MVHIVIAALAKEETWLWLQGCRKALMFYKQSLWMMCKHQLCTACILIPPPANGFRASSFENTPQGLKEL